MEHHQPATWIDIAYALAMGLPATIAAVLGWLSSRKANAKIDTNTEITKEANDKIDTNTAITKEVHSKVNGRVDELITAEREMARARGRAEGILDEQHRQTVFAKAIIKQSSERTNSMIRLIDAIAGQGPTLDVLIVEDSEIDAVVLHRILSKHNMRCEIANTAVEAVERLLSKSYGAIFADLDLQCPISRSGNLVKSLMNNAPSTPMFVVTGFADKWVIEAMRLLGVIATIHKPATDEALSEVFHNLSNRSV